MTDKQKPPTTRERIGKEGMAKMKALWQNTDPDQKEKLSAEKIADLFGVTKSTVIGLAKRNGWGDRSYFKKDFSPPAEFVKDKAPDPAAWHVGKRSACQWPYGTPGEPDFRFCGAGRLEGSSYCSSHKAISVAG